jgi:polygalacturonase
VPFTRVPPVAGASEKQIHPPGADDRASGSTARAATCDVREFGARGDGVALDTEAINRALSAPRCAWGYIRLSLSSTAQLFF